LIFFERNTIFPGTSVAGRADILEIGSEMRARGLVFNLKGVLALTHNGSRKCFLQAKQLIIHLNRIFLDMY